MRTTVRINDSLLKQAKQLASRQGRTLTSIVEEGLVLVVNRERDPLPVRKRIEIPVSKAFGQILPGVNLDSNAELEDLLNS